MIKFEWDKKKAAANIRKHGITFDDATTVFADPFSWTFPDNDHSEDEERYISIGMSQTGQLLVVAHTDRGGKIRIITAREATRKERTYYEEINEG